MATEACEWCHGEGSQDGQFCLECDAGEKAEAAYAEQMEREHGWMRSYVKAARFYEQDGQPEAAEAIRRMCIT